MPKSRLTAVTINQIWDDGFSIDLNIKRAADDNYGRYVTLKQDDDIINIYTESWVEIREQINNLMIGIEEENNDSL